MCARLFAHVCLPRGVRAPGVLLHCSAVRGRGMGSYIRFLSQIKAIKMQCCFLPVLRFLLHWPQLITVNTKPRLFSSHILPDSRIFLSVIRPVWGKICPQVNSFPLFASSWRAEFKTRVVVSDWTADNRARCWCVIRWVIRVKHLGFVRVSFSASCVSVFTGVFVFDLTTSKILPLPSIWSTVYYVQKNATFILMTLFFWDKSKLSGWSSLQKLTGSSSSNLTVQISRRGYA